LRNNGSPPLSESHSTTVYMAIENDFFEILHRIHSRKSVKTGTIGNHDLVMLFCLPGS
jgi:hypothetical protein